MARENLISLSSVLLGAVCHVGSDDHNESYGLLNEVLEARVTNGLHAGKSKIAYRRCKVQLGNTLTLNPFIPNTTQSKEMVYETTCLTKQFYSSFDLRSMKC
jgi:hypothetical protein